MLKNMLLREQYLVQISKFKSCRNDKNYTLQENQTKNLDLLRLFFANCLL